MRYYGVYLTWGLWGGPRALPPPGQVAGPLVAPPLLPLAAGPAPANAGPSAGPPPKKQRTMVEELRDLSALRSSGVVSQEEFQTPKANVLRE